MTVIKNHAHRDGLVLRLRRVEGQLRGIQAMIESGADCEKVAMQLSASRRALDKAFFTMLSCAIEADPSAARLLAKFG